MISGSDSTKLFDGYVDFEPEEVHDLPEGIGENIVEREELEKMAREARALQTHQKNYISPESQKLIDRKAQQIGAIIAEWVFLAADSGDWSYKYDMTPLDAMYLAPTLIEVRRLLPGTFITSSNSSKNRWISVNWNDGNEV